MKAYGGIDVQSHVFLISALARGEWSASRPSRFSPGAHWVGGRVDPRTSLDDVENIKILPISGLELRPLCRPARSQSLYRFRYPGSVYTNILIYFIVHGVVWWVLEFISLSLFGMRDRIYKLCRFHWKDYECTQNCIRNPERRSHLKDTDVNKLVNNIKMDLESNVWGWTWPT
jgi:hypothetical protein